jgi:hypothetical protein
LLRRPRFSAALGYYAKLVRDRESPTTYETRAQRQARQDAERHRQREREEAQRLQDAYDEYWKQEIEHYIAEELTAEGSDKGWRAQFASILLLAY